MLISMHILVLVITIASICEIAAFSLKGRCHCVYNCNFGFKMSRLFSTANTHNDDSKDSDNTILSILGEKDQNLERGSVLYDSDSGRSDTTNDQQKKNTKLRTKKKSMKDKLEIDIIALTAFFTVHGHYRVPYYYVVPDPGNENSCINSRVRRKNTIKEELNIAVENPNKLKNPGFSYYDGNGNLKKVDLGDYDGRGRKDNEDKSLKNDNYNTNLINAPIPKESFEVYIYIYIYIYMYIFVCVYVYVYIYI
jgi:hypothetical protein